MPKRSIRSSIYYERLLGHLKNIEHTRKKMESLYSQKKIAERDLNFVYSGLFLDIITHFENTIENMFIDLLIGKSIHSSKKVKVKVAFPSKNICRDIIYELKQRSQSVNPSKPR